jgi:hypothetical protein
MHVRAGCQGRANIAHYMITFRLRHEYRMDLEPSGTAEQRGCQHVVTTHRPHRHEARSPEARCITQNVLELAHFVAAILRRCQVVTLHPQRAARRTPDNKPLDRGGALHQGVGNRGKTGVC